MSLFDDSSKQVGGIAGVAMKNPQVIAAVVSLLSTRDSSVGGTGGLAGLVQAFQGKGMGDSAGCARRGLTRSAPGCYD
jgi:hypothetical protein